MGLAQTCTAGSSCPLLPFGKVSNLPPDFCQLLRGRHCSGKKDKDLKFMRNNHLACWDLWISVAKMVETVFSNALDLCILDTNCTLPAHSNKKQHIRTRSSFIEIKDAGSMKPGDTTEAPHERHQFEAKIWTQKWFCKRFQKNKFLFFLKACSSVCRLQALGTKLWNCATEMASVLQ